MKTKFYVNNDEFIAGMTLKTEGEAEENNMALHVADDDKAVICNRTNLAHFLNVRLDDFVFAEQTHSNYFYKVTRKDIGRGTMSMVDAIPETDALYTFEPNIVLGSFTADCVPVMFFHKEKGVVGVIHSGWQGTVTEITRRVFQQLIEVERCEPEGFFVYIGPAISQEKFEVDVDVYEQFRRLGIADEFMYYNEMTNKYHIDNKQTVKRQCELEGVPSEHVFIDPMCTFESSEGFSYRRNKQTGRHLSFIMRKA